MPGLCMWSALAAHSYHGKLHPSLKRHCNLLQWGFWIIQDIQNLQCLHLGWRDDSAAKSTCFSGTVPTFRSLQPYWQGTNICNCCSRWSNVLLWLLWTPCMHLAHRLTYKVLTSSIDVSLTSFKLFAKISHFMNSFFY